MKSFAIADHTRHQATASSIVAFCASWLCLRGCLLPGGRSSHAANCPYAVPLRKQDYSGAKGVLPGKKTSLDGVNHVERCFPKPDGAGKLSNRLRSGMDSRAMRVGMCLLADS